MIQFQHHLLRLALLGHQRADGHPDLGQRLPETVQLLLHRVGLKLQSSLEFWLLQDELL